jgi:alpha-glucosidase
MKKSTYLFSILSFASLLFIASCASPKEKVWNLVSPDKNIQISVTLETDQNQKTTLTYHVDRMVDGKLVAAIESSPMGLERKDQQFKENLTFVSKSTEKTIDEKYTMTIGRQTNCHNNAQEMELTFKNEKGSLMQVVLRAYNDGVAFKYVFPENTPGNFTVTNELTGFKIPKNGICWIQKYDKPAKYSPAYEQYYEAGIPIGSPSPNVEGWGFPALFNTNGHWMLISEANLQPNYCGIRMEQNAPEGLYKVRFPNPLDALGTGEVLPTSTLPWVMPWRTIMIGGTPGAIVESNMINNVSDPAVAGDFSWVKPGRSSWSWLSDIDSPQNFNSLKKFVDLCVEMKWEYSMVDANWDLMKGGTVEQLIQYANSKGIKILMWYNSSGPQSIVTERPRDIMYDPIRRKAEFKKLQEWGVKGVKVDFWHSEKQNMIALYHDVIKDAAEHQIMVNVHGCTIPRGWSRTYPNLVSFEAVKGAEQYLFDTLYTTQAPIQNSILAFTRNVIGPMDYTPVIFNNYKYPHTTSFAHEMALSLVFNSGVLHFADNVKSYQSLPDYAKTFLSEVPTTFDETKYISGAPGESIVLASRKGKDWYISGINSEKTPKTITIDAPFFGEGQYKLSLITDGKDTKSFAHEARDFKKGEKISVTMLGLGGFVAKMAVK